MALLRCTCVHRAFYTVCPQQISELSVDVESKQKELQSVQQDKSSLEQQLGSLVRKEGALHIIITNNQEREEKRERAPFRHGTSHISALNHLLKFRILGF